MNGFELIRPEVAGPYEVAFTTRRGGVSDGPFASLNLGLKTGDEPDRVVENRRLICAETGSDLESLALGFQYHSAIVNRARVGLRGLPGDGLWSEEPGLPILTLGADCLLIALMRRNGSRPAVSVLHAGWKGLLAGIAEAGVATVAPAPAAVIGPGIGPCCYEVLEDVAGPFRARFGADLIRGGKLDLWTAAERALREAGCSSVVRTDLCTACDPGRFFSRRRQGAPSGVQGLLARVT